jgi:hypothetical protein
LILLGLEEKKCVDSYYSVWGKPSADSVTQMGDKKNKNLSAGCAA